MRSPRPGHGDERGAVALTVVIVLVVLLGLLGFVLNAGHATSAQGELQNSADAAALAAARELDGTSSGVAAARQVGAAFAQLYTTDGTLPVNIDPNGDVRFCNWDHASGTINWCLPWGADPTAGPPPSPTPGASTEIQAANAVQIRDGRESARGNALPVWFSAFLGNVSTIDARATATAAGGGPCQTTRPLFPLAYLSCQTSGPDGVPCNSVIVFRDGNQDTAAFTNLNSGGGVGSGQVLSLLDAAIAGDPVAPVSVDQSIDLDSSLTGFGLWNALRGTVDNEYTVPVVYSDSCQIDTQLPIIGFATVQINGVYSSFLDRPPPACLDGRGFPSPCIVATLTCDQQITAPAGCGLFGLAALTSRLVH